MTVVAYPGREGGHTAAAADALFPGAQLLSTPSFRAVTASVLDGGAAYGVLPIESSLVGPIAETHDLLYDSPLSIVGETVLHIRHELAAPGPIALEELRVIRSHPAALDQCRRLLDRLPHVQAIAAPTTADAARQVAEDGDPREAAIASEKAIRLYGLTVLEEDVGDHPEAFTRFVSLAPYTTLARNGSGGYRTAFTFVTDHRPGALHAAIEPFARLGLDLVQLVSRPIPRRPWRYRFDAVLTGHPLDHDVSEALRELRDRTVSLRVLGAYPKA